MPEDPTPDGHKKSVKIYDRPASADKPANRGIIIAVIIVAVLIVLYILKKMLHIHTGLFHH